MTPSRGFPALERAQDFSFLLLALVLPWTIAPMGIATGLCAALAVTGFALGSGRWTRTPVDLPAIGWALALTLAALFAVDREASLPRLTKALFPALIGLAAAHAGREALGRRALAVLLASASLAALLGLGIFLAHGASFAARARGPAGHYMTFGGQLMMFLSVAIALALAARERRWRLAGLAASLPLALALAATFTRSAWLGLIAAAFTMLAVLRPRLLPVLALAVVLLVVLAPAPIRARLTGMFDPANAYNRERTFMWDAGFRMYRDHPVTGVGLMDLHSLYDRYRDPKSAERAGHLHSVPIHLAATTGTLGLLAFAALFAALLWCATRGLRRQLARGGLGGALRLGVTGALVGFLVSGLFEWNLGDEELLYPLYALVGLAWGARSWDPPGGEPRA